MNVKDLSQIDTKRSGLILHQIASDAAINRAMDSIRQDFRRNLLRKHIPGNPIVSKHRCFRVHHTYTVACGCPGGKNGIALTSTTLRCSTPMTLALLSTTAILSSALPILQVAAA